MRKLWWLAPTLTLIVAIGWWRWPHFQLARAEGALNDFPAPNSLYWPGQSAGSPVLSDAAKATALAQVTRALESADARLGQTPRSFYLRGRLASLRGAHAEAVRLMRLATLLDSDNATLQMAYGVSLGLRAAAEHRSIDWATAANALMEASELPGFPALGFANLAEVSAQLPAPQVAIDYWKKAAASVNDSRKTIFIQRLQAAEGEARGRRERVAQVASRRVPSRDIPGSAELLLHLALSEWLPRRAEFDAELSRLALYFRTELTDPVLHDLLAAPTNDLADQALGRASLANAAGEYSTAAEAGVEAGILYARAGNAAGQAVSGVQASYALRRSGRSAECLPLAERSRQIGFANGYRWVDLRAQQESAACKSRQRVIDMLSESESLVARIQGSGFLDLELRANSALVEPFHAFTAPVESWERGHRGLAVYWRSVLPAPFATNFYSPLGMMAESFGYSRLAALLFRESMAVMEGHPNQWLRAAIRSDFFRLDPSAKLPGETTNEIESASQDIAAGQADRALVRLRRVTNGAEFPYRQLDHDSRIMLLPMMGRAFWQQGNRPEALRHYRVLVEETVAIVNALRGRRQRHATALEIGPAWRLLTEAQLDTEGATAALRTWQTFRTLANPAQPIRLSPPSGEAWLAVALLPSGPVVWWADAQGLALHRIGQPQLTRLAQRFAALVANPGSPLAIVNQSGRELYDLLIAPFESRFAGARTLIVDPDGPLAVLPWGALRDREGRALLSRIAVVQTIGWGSAPVLRPSLDWPLDWQPALVVAEPAVDPRDRPRFPVLSAGLVEAAHLRYLFPQHLYLSGAGARVEALQQQLSHHRLFHFAGHGVANGGNGALVLAAEPRVGTRLITAAEIADLDLHALRLATLAACSSGAGEDGGSVNVESLVQAFLDAGTSQVLASRWNVDSRATAQMMERFYDRLQQGIAPAAALREAALAVAQDPLQQHPYFWAAFQLFGLP